MEVTDRIIVVTGGASGIGRAMCERFAAEGARHLVVADLNGEGAAEVAAAIGGSSRRVDVGVEQDLVELIDATEREIGPIDLFCSNAGISIGRELNEPDEVWDTIWRVNTMAHVWAARHLVPRMIGRGGGYLLNTASAAGLLTQIGSVTYAVTKHAAVALAEWIAITHGRQGIKVSVLCPQAVRTAMTADGPRRRCGRRHDRTGASGGCGGRSAPGRAFSGAAAPGSCAIHPSQGIRLRPLAARNAALAGTVSGRVSVVFRLVECSMATSESPMRRPVC